LSTTPPLVEVKEREETRVPFFLLNPSAGAWALPSKKDRGRREKGGFKLPIAGWWPSAPNN